MVKEVQYTSVRRVLDDLLDHPLLSDLTLEQVVRHTLRFMNLHGFSKLYQDREADVEIKDFRGVLPCDLVSIIQVKDCKTGICLRSMTDSFIPGLSPFHEKHNNYGKTEEDEKPRRMHRFYLEEMTFKTQGQIIYTSFPEGAVRVAYKAIPVDEDGFPMVVDNENYLAALEAYIKKQVFTVKFDIGKLSAQILRNAQIEYGDLASQLIEEFQTPSVSEMESISRMITTLIPKVREFDKGFVHSGDRQYLRRH